MALSMDIRSILIVPVPTLVETGARPWLLRATTAIKRRFAPSEVYDAELLFYADLPRVLGPDRVFVSGRFYPHFASLQVPDECSYPSCHGTPEPTFVAPSALADTISRVDAVLVSTRAGKAGGQAIAEARRRGRPVALLDFKDHPENYGRAARGEGLCRGFTRGRDFDLYFKKDLPLGGRNDFILPLAPVPVRPESYAIPPATKEIDVFYSGRTRLGCQADRGETIELVKARFPQALIFEHDVKRQSFFSTRHYWRELGRARLALSPSGKVWDSLRHCEVGLAAGTALIAPRPYIETVGPPLRDGANAILYETEFRDGKYHLKDPAELTEKIRYYLDHPLDRERIAAKWAEDVQNGHTILARSRYILEEMTRAFA